MDEQITHEVNLSDGTRVVFGHRLSAADLFKIDADPAAQNPTQYADLLLRAHIVEFGTLPQPVPVPVLLGLDSIDREDLVEGCNVYQTLSLGDRESEFLPDFKVKLAFGFKVNDVVYNRVTFGKRITGLDEVAADKEKLEPGIKRLCFLIGRQISEVSSDDGTATLTSPIPLSYFDSLDAADVASLRGGAEMWRQSFRIRREKVSRNGVGPGGDNPGAKVQVDRGASASAAAGAAANISE